MYDLHNKINVIRAISPVTSSDDTPLVSQIIDMKGFKGLEFLIALGSIGDTNATFTVLVEHDDASGFGTAAAVPDSQLLGTEAEASFQFDDDNETRKIGYVGDKRYVRMTITPSGNSGTPSGALIGALAVQHNSVVEKVA